MTYSIVAQTKGLPGYPAGAPEVTAVHSYLDSIGRLVTEVFAAGERVIFYELDGTIYDDVWDAKVEFFAAISIPDREAFIRWGRQLHRRQWKAVHDRFRVMMTPEFTAAAAAEALGLTA
jgi:hypothetical protein